MHLLRGLEIRAAHWNKSARAEKVGIVLAVGEKDSVRSGGILLRRGAALQDV